MSRSAPRLASFAITKAEVRAVEKRIEPLLTHQPVWSMTLEQLMAGAYLQGMRDACEVLARPEARGSE